MTIPGCKFKPNNLNLWYHGNILLYTHVKDRQGGGRAGGNRENWEKYFETTQHI